ncbi:hypothetical protein [Nocardioides coralli]|uniref:hypothetical protein n=1 Tax=Nocardioides coralli TaxID=2872154 RepID=UPI001CA44772|nr:hypothetical protein [Nocardioides coralli]QZY29734.1 hypothetical protein K6T13_03300 [Nocardioides coralli]
MTQRAWYLRRGVAWQPVLGCCAAAAVVAALVARWPESSPMMLPALLACCAAAAGFVFDEPATSVVTVTPRGSDWRRTARAAVALLPLALWAAVVLARPGDLPLSRPGWLLIGAVAVGTGLGAAGLASRRGVARPGSGLAAVLAVAILAPVVTVGFLGIDSPYPLGPFSDPVRTAWLVAAGVAGLLLLAALAPVSDRTVARLVGTPR